MLKNFYQFPKTLTLILSVILVTGFLFLFSQSSQVSACSPLEISHYNVVFNGRTLDNQNNTSTWSYTVYKIGCGPDLSHWIWQPCFSLEELLTRFVATTPEASEVGPDGSTGHYGVKWEMDGAVWDSSGITFTITITGQPDIDEDGAIAVIKAGQAGDHDHGNQPHFDLTIPGPSCEPTQPYCGDGNVDCSEECDEGVDNGIECTPEYGSFCNYCSTECTVVELQGPYCGDGNVDQPYEECETDENCTCGRICVDCMCKEEPVEPVCGNGILEGDEECDDGNNNNGDGCSATCKIEEEPNLGSITVCKIIIGPGGDIVDGSELSGKEFTIPGFTPDPEPSTGAPVGEIPDSIFTTPLLLNTDLIGDDGVNDAECITYSNLSLGGYYYDEETKPETDWEEPLYNDQFQTSIEGLEDFFQYSGELFDGDSSNDEERNTDADGHIILTESRPERTLVILDQYKEIEITTIKAYKVVCETEEDLPNWATSGTQDGEPSMITETTAQDYVDSSGGKCWLEENWDFQWGFDGEAQRQSGDHIGPAPIGTGWYDFDSSTSTSTPAVVQISELDDTTRIWVRENLKAGYIPFPYPPGDSQDDVSAEMLCHTEILNYDNYDYIINPELGQIYYCVAFNTQIEEPGPYCGDGNLDPEEECDDGKNNGQACVPACNSSCSYCSNECTLVTLQGGLCGGGGYSPRCGNGILDYGEECDGNAGLLEGYTCTSSCTLEKIACDMDLDVMIIMDVSGSMGYEVPTRLSQAIIAANNFLGNLRNEDQSGLVSFSWTATLNKSLSNQHALTQSIINGLTANGATNISQAIDKANSELISANANPEALKVQILLTDGRTNRPNGDGSIENPNDVALTIAKSLEAANKGIIIFTVGLGDSINTEMLQTIANNTGGQYYFAPNTSDLEGIFNQIAYETCNYEFELSALTVYNEGIESVSENSVTVSWYTNIPGTSRVVYGEQPVLSPGSPPNYGYAYSTPETDTTNKVIFHLITVDNLIPNTTYYLRGISHTSPDEVLGEELIFTTQPLTEEPAGSETTPEEEKPKEEIIEEIKEEVEEEKPEEKITEEEPETGFEKFLAAIGTFFNLGNFCWFLFLIIVILIILFLLSIKERGREEREKRKRWVLLFTIIILIILYCFLCCLSCFFCCPSCWFLIIITGISVISSLLLRKKREEDRTKSRTSFIG